MVVVHNNHPEQYDFGQRSTTAVSHEHLVLVRNDFAIDLAMKVFLTVVEILKIQKSVDSSIFDEIYDIVIDSDRKIIVVMDAYDIGKQSWILMIRIVKFRLLEMLEKNDDNRHWFVFQAI